MSHTPGPWKACSGAGHPYVVTVFHDEQGRRCTAFVAICDATTLPNAENARLIAAAPDMLAALKGLLSADGRCVYATSDVIAAGNAAIAKAEGR